MPATDDSDTEAMVKIGAGEDAETAAGAAIGAAIGAAAMGLEAAPLRGDAAGAEGVDAGAAVRAPAADESGVATGVVVGTGAVALSGAGVVGG